VRKTKIWEAGESEMERIRRLDGRVADEMASDKTWFFMLNLNVYRMIGLGLSFAWEKEFRGCEIIIGPAELVFGWET